jgi:hypothetical protein
MSDWQEYLNKQIKCCFGNLIDAKDIYWAVRFLDEKRRAKGNLVTTPRSINKFVNHMAALYSQRSSAEIEVSTIAYYAAFDEIIEDNMLNFLQAERDQAAPPADNWQIQLAAIHYGVDLIKARQILLSDPIRNSIAKFDREVFRELTVIPGFSTECIRVLSSPTAADTGEADFEFVTNAALLLRKASRCSPPATRS